MPIVLEALGRVLALVGDVVLGGAGVTPAILLAALLGAASVAAAIALVRIAAARGLIGSAAPPLGLERDRRGRPDDRAQRARGGGRIVERRGGHLV
ncbi:hypothetical protein, partial [Clavibacter michiganensis]|uniref:hypothetical protein n=1 Tax=Clavibacter michiganensis TaxID=28447 RepID=UPI0029300691